MNENVTLIPARRGSLRAFIPMTVYLALTQRNVKALMG